MLEKMKKRAQEIEVRERNAESKVRILLLSTRAIVKHWCPLITSSGRIDWWRN
jgi:hypothetical protein